MDRVADPYENVELGTATRLGGAMALVGFAFALVSLLLSPPSGPLGWEGVAAFMGLALVAGVHQLCKKTPTRPDVLLAGAYVALVASGAYRAAAGEAAPFE